MDESANKIDARNKVMALARALDRDDFVTAAGYVHPECAYESPGGRMAGREAIIESYRGNAIWVRATFDRIEFESHVEPMDDCRCRVTYTDRTWHKPRVATGQGISPTNALAHVYRCQQILTVGEGELITHIEHIEIPGEREALEVYFQACGVKRPG